MVNKKETSKRVASIASKLLRTSKSPKVKSVAGSDLAQTTNKGQTSKSKSKKK